MEEERSQQQFCFLEEDEGKKTKKGWKEKEEKDKETRVKVKGKRCR
jgi:hypothetical protein